MENITIRAMRTADLPLLAALKLAAEKQTMPFITRVLRTPDEELAFLTETSKRCEITVSVLDMRIIGFTAMNGDVMEQLFVHPDFHGRRVGSVLLEEQQRTRSDIRLAVIRENANAIAFYKYHGFAFLRDVPDSNADQYVWHRKEG